MNRRLLPIHRSVDKNNRRSVDAGLACVPDAGESDGALSVWGAVRSLQADRIGHGVRAVEDERLLHFLAEHQIPLEVNPTSNVCLNVYRHIDEHPLPRIDQAGVLVTVNTDDPQLFDTTLTKEYQLLVDAFGYGHDDVIRIARNAFTACRAESELKRRLLDEFDGWACVHIDADNGGNRMTDHDAIPCTHSQLVNDLRRLGVAPGETVMLNGSVKAVGPVVGGPNVIIQAILDTVGTEGTLMMYAGWQDIPDFVGELPPSTRQMYYDEHPPFDPLTARAVRDHSILAQFLCFWPGAHRSLNPEASIVAVGAHADHITRDHALNYGYGDGSPLERLVKLRGSALMLGAPLNTITLLHYVENRARIAHKNVVRYQCPIQNNGRTVWVDIEDFDTGTEHADYTLDGIALSYLAAGRGRKGYVGNAESYLFDAADLADYAVIWLEERFG